MATKDLDNLTKETIKTLKKLSGDKVSESSNAAEYAKFLQKTNSTARTFDKASPDYIDYVARGVKPKKAKASDEKPAPKKEKTQQDESATEAKKRKAAAPKKEDDEGKSTKKVKNG